jgi:hypothetical protein
MNKPILNFCIVAFLLFHQVNAYAQPTTTGMLAYFNLNGNTTNSGPANITATAVNTSYTTNSLNTPNTAVQFGGNLNSYLDFVDNGNLDFSGTNNFTVSFFFFFNGTTTSGLIDNCLNYNGWGVWLWSTVAGTWNLQFNYRNGSVGSAAATAFTTNAWHHVAAVRNNGTLSIYIDGAFRLSGSEGTGTPSYPMNMIAGAMAYNAFSPPRYNPYGGKLDEIRIYNRALTPAEITVLAGAVTLPLTLGEFNVVKKTGGNLLHWQTLHEESYDGSSWNTLGRVNAAGSSSVKLNYEFTDIADQYATIFYRLKMVDTDNKFAYSRVVALKSGIQSAGIAIYPNPVGNSLNMQVSSALDDLSTISIVDVSGRRLYTQQLVLKKGINTSSLLLGFLKPAVYWVIIEGKNGKQRAQFVKQ